MHATTTLAFDEASARSLDADGRMRVRDCIISVAEVNPYWGKEIPNAQRFKLLPHQLYDLYRDPAELQRAASSFDGLPLMIRHVVQTADEPQKDYIGGSVYNTRFKDGKLRADLLIMDAKAIDYVESGELSSLSSAYHYDVDMRDGVTSEGRKYHGVMRNMHGNHVALVNRGRATGAVVADSALQLTPETTTNGVQNVDPILNTNELQAPTPETSNADIAKALLTISQTLGRVETFMAGQVKAPEPALPAVEMNEADGGVTVTESTESGDSEVKVTDEDKDGKVEVEEKKEMAMDAKIKAAVNAAVTATNKRRDALDAAKRSTRSVLGDVIAMDSAGDVYRAALRASGISDASVPRGGEQIAWQAYQAGSSARGAYLAMDSQVVDANAKPRSFADDLKRLKIKG